MSEIDLKYFIFNGKICDEADFEKLYINVKPTVYEVIRVINGIPLFLEEHYNRLIKSTKLLNKDLCLSYETIRSKINKLVELNSVHNHNIKIIINNFNEPSQNYYFYFVKTKYPSSEMYNIGVDTFTYKAIRENPNAKIINTDLRNGVDNLLTANNCFEAILVNDKNEVTEGSRSNLFFIKNDKIYTAPSKDVLIGITRKRIINQCQNNNIEVIESVISADNLDDFEAAFISGTSPKVLPIAKIDDIKYDVKNPLLLKAMNIYNTAIDKYIEENNSK